MRPLAAFLAMLYAGDSAGEFVTERVRWGEADGREVNLYTVTNSGGATLRMTDYGAKVVELHVPDKHGKLADVVLGFDNLDQYLAPNQSMGATIGRYANRIRDAQFEIDGIVYELTKNEGDNNIHGGGEFENVIWAGRFVSNELGKGIRFEYQSPDGAHGFPGNLDVAVTYSLTSDNAVHVAFEATTDKATHVNFTQHSYFNLNGAKATVLDHVASINASRYLVMDEVLATGEVGMLAGKPWDLSSPTRLGDNVKQIPLGGYHHDYIVDKAAGELGIVATVADPESGRVLRVSSTQPDVTFYVAMGLTPDIVGKYGIAYGPYMGFCIETQHPVDAANHPAFASTLLRPGEIYRETVIYDFDVDEEL